MKSYAGAWAAVVVALRERAPRPLPHRRTHIRQCPILLGAVIEHLRFLIVVGSLVGIRTAVAFPRAPPTCRVLALAPSPGAHVSVSHVPPGTRLAQDHSFGYRHLLLRSSCRSLRFFLRTLLVRSSLTVPPTLSVDDASSSLRLTISYDLRHGSSTCSSSFIVVYSAVTCSRNDAFPSPPMSVRECASPPPLTIGPSSCVGRQPRRLVMSLRLFIQ